MAAIELAMAEAGNDVDHLIVDLLEAREKIDNPAIAIVPTLSELFSGDSIGAAKLLAVALDRLVTCKIEHGSYNNHTNVEDDTAPVLQALKNDADLRRTIDQLAMIIADLRGIELTEDDASWCQKAIEGWMPSDHCGEPKDECHCDEPA